MYLLVFMDVDVKFWYHEKKNVTVWQTDTNSWIWKCNLKETTRKTNKNNSNA